MNAIALTRALRRTLKVLHTIGAAGFMGGLAALAAVLVVGSEPGGAGSSASSIAAMARIAAWLVGPSMILTVVSGLLAMLANPAFYDVGWVWLKAGTGILVLEGGLHVLGPIQEEARRNAGALARAADPATLARLLASELGTVWVLLAVAAANVVLGVWRPRFLNLSS